MATLVGTQKDMMSLLHALIELDFDAIEAYRVAVARLDRVEFREQMTVWMNDHTRHVETLSHMVRRLGGTPPTHGDAKQLLTKGKVWLGDLFGGDRAILAAMKDNEDDTCTAYGRAAANRTLPDDLNALVKGHLEDELRHRAWLEQRLALIDEEDESLVASDSDEAVCDYKDSDVRL